MQALIRLPKKDVMKSIFICHHLQHFEEKAKLSQYADTEMHPLFLHYLLGDSAIDYCNTTPNPRDCAEQMGKVLPVVMKEIIDVSTK